MMATGQSARGVDEQDVVLAPASRGGEWRAWLLRAAEAKAGDARAKAFRRELGLPVDGPVVMSGHQAQFWHPGILAKYFAGDALAAGAGGAACFSWLVVEQDANDPTVVRLPVRRGANGNGVGGADVRRGLRVESWAVDGSKPSAVGEVPVGGRAAVRPAASPVLERGESWAAASVGAGIESIRAALVKRAGERSAAAQFGEAVLDLLEPLSNRRAKLVLSLSMARTALFAEVVSRMRADAAACIAAYNAAVAAHPNERVQRLGEDELPMWVMEASAAGTAVRRRAVVGDLGRAPSEFAPRALLMTGLLRWAGCDLFIHGTGGGGDGEHAGYDRITEQWLRDWWGHEVVLSPAVVATATMRLNIEHDGPGPEELRRSQWLAHRAMHDPGLLNDAGADARKRAMVEEIRVLKRSGADARPVYRQMHTVLRESRESHAARLVEFKHAADSAASRIGDAQIAMDRTWAFPLYEEDQLRGLRERVARELGI